MRKPLSTKSRAYGVLTLGLVVALVVATGRPDEDAAAWIDANGLPTFVLYLAPMVVALAALALGTWLSPGRPVLLRLAIYAVLGAVVGAVMGRCLDLFAAAPAIIEAIAGPLAAPGKIEMLLWALTALCVAMGLMVLALALIGGSAVVAMNVDDVDAEALEILRTERVTFGWSAAGMLGLALSIAALAVARQAGDGAALGPAITSILGLIVYTIASIVLWRRFDELERRHVVDAFSISAIIVTFGAFVWAIVDVVVGAPAIDAAGLFLTLVFLQTLATFYVTGRMMGNSSVLAKPA